MCVVWRVFSKQGLAYLLLKYRGIQTPTQAPSPPLNFSLVHRFCLLQVEKQERRSQSQSTLTPIRRADPFVVMPFHTPPQRSQQSGGDGDDDGDDDDNDSNGKSAEGAMMKASRSSPGSHRPAAHYMSDTALVSTRSEMAASKARTASVAATRKAGNAGGGGGSGGKSDGDDDDDDDDDDNDDDNVSASNASSQGTDNPHPPPDMDGHARPPPVVAWHSPDDSIVTTPAGMSTATPRRVVVQTQDVSLRACACVNVRVCVRALPLCLFVSLSLS